MTVDYIGEIKQAIKRNKELVLKEIDSEKMTLKIANWANRFDYSFDVIKQKILDDEIFGNNILDNYNSCILISS